jgi:hypothetical protein
MTCYADLSVREEYPQLIPLSPGAEDLVSGRELLRAAPAPGKLLSPPKTAERVEELAERYQNRQELFCEGDLPAVPMPPGTEADVSRPAGNGTPAITEPLRRRASAAFKEWQGRRVMDAAACVDEE